MHYQCLDASKPFLLIKEGGSGVNTLSSGKKAVLKAFKLLVESNLDKNRLKRVTNILSNILCSLTEGQVIKDIEIINYLEDELPKENAVKVLKQIYNLLGE
jgi:hypothetical protein